MSTWTIAGIAIGSTGPVNGATCYAWKASRFGSAPVQNTSPPSGSADAGPVTSGTTYGSGGAYQLACPTNESYWIEVVYGGQIYWTYFNGVAFTDTTTTVALIDPIYLQTSGDSFERVGIFPSGLMSVQPPYSPMYFGVHDSGDAAGGTDLQWYFEGLADTAYMWYWSFPRAHLTDGTHYLFLSAPPFTGASLNASQYITMEPGSPGTTSSLATAGSFSVSSALFGSGTISYTGLTITSASTATLTGCTSSGIAYNADTSNRIGVMLTDPYSAPIWWLTGYGGMYLNGLFHFQYDGVFTSNEYDIIIGFMNWSTNNGGSAIFYGYDKNVFTYRSQDIYGNNQFIVTADANTVIYDVAGMYTNNAQEFGSYLARWGGGWFNLLSTNIISKSISYNIPTAGTTSYGTILMSGTTTATLPTAVGIPGLLYTIINVGTGSVTVATTSSQNINGASTYSLATQYSWVTVQSDGSNWWAISGSAGGGGSGSVVPANIQTSSYTPVVGDLGKVIEMNSSSATTITLAPAVFSAGDTFEVCQVGTGAVSFVASTGGTPSITHIAQTANYGTPLSTLTVSPATIGNVQILSVYNSTTSASVGSISGGGCASWTRIGTAVVGSDTNYTTEMWMGTVTGTGSSTLTITWSGTIGTAFCYLVCHEFNSGLLGGISWAVDVHGSVNTTSTSTAVTGPSLTATGSNELYINMLFGTNNFTAGSTSGFNYYGGGSQEMIMYDMSVSGTKAPTATETSAGYYSGVGAILIASGASFTIDSYSSYVQLYGQWATATVRYRSGSEAVISGALTT